MSDDNKVKTRSLRISKANLDKINEIKEKDNSTQDKVITKLLELHKEIDTDKKDLKAENEKLKKEIALIKTKYSKVIGDRYNTILSVLESKIEISVTDAEAQVIAPLKVDTKPKRKRTTAKSTSTDTVKVFEEAKKEFSTTIAKNASKTNQNASSSSK